MAEVCSWPSGLHCLTCSGECCSCGRPVDRTERPTQCEAVHPTGGRCEKAAQHMGGHDPDARYGRERADYEARWFPPDQPPGMPVSEANTKASRPEGPPLPALLEDV